MWKRGNFHKIGKNSSFLYFFETLKRCFQKNMSKKKKKKWQANFVNLHVLVLLKHISINSEQVTKCYDENKISLWKNLKNQSVCFVFSTTLTNIFGTCWKLFYWIQHPKINKRLFFQHIIVRWFFSDLWYRFRLWRDFFWFKNRNNCSVIALKGLKGVLP